MTLQDAMSIHLPVSREDAMTMLDSRVPLTRSERKMIIDGLWDLAFRAGETAEKQRMKDAVTKIFEDKIHMFPMTTGEYSEPTQAMRRKLEDKDRQIRKLTEDDRFSH